MSNPAPRRSKAGKTLELRAAESRRLRRVAALRNRGLGLDEITDALGQSGLVNPGTQKGWSRNSIYNDLKTLLANDQTAAARDHGEWFAQHLAEQNELLRQAWAEKDLAAAQRALDARAKLLGLNKPDKHAFTDPTGEHAAPLLATAIDFTVMTVEQHRQWIEILHTQRLALAET